MTSTSFWELPPSIEPTEDDWRRAISDIVSQEFDIRLNVVSDVRSFLRAAVTEPAVIKLYEAMVGIPRARKAVLEQIQHLSRLEVDRRYQNPNDTALAVFLLLVMFADPRYGEIAADVVDHAPQCWYAKKIARRILNPPPVASENLEDRPHELAITRTLSTDRMTPVDLSLQLGWHWSDRTVNIEAVMTKDGLPEVLN
jgi:hypothetical protein